MAETTIEPGRRGDKLRGDDAKPAKLRLITRRSRLLGAQGELWPNWRYHSFVTDRDDLDTKAADAYHRNHATVELAIRDLKEGSGLSRCPSGQFFANGAWLACCVLAHNLARWAARLGRTHPARQLTVAATIRNRLLTVPGRLVNHSGRHRLRLPLNWPWPPSPPPCNKSATCPNSSEPPTAPGAAQPNPTRHQPAPAPHPNPARPKTRRPAHTHQPSGHPAPTADPTSPSVDSGSGRADAVEVSEGAVRPVEYKAGTRHGRAADLQVCAQGLCLEEMLGLEVPYGYVWYGATRRRNKVAFTTELRRDVLSAVDSIRSQMTSGRLPTAPNDARCPACQLLHHCLPEVSDGRDRVRGFLREEIYRCDT